MSTNNILWVPPLPPKAQEKANRHHRQLFKWTGFSGKTLWDWMNLIGILLVPLMIGILTLSTATQQSQIAQDQQQETALQTYLDHMSDLLLNNKLRESQPEDEVRNVARARTLTILPQLDGARKGEIVRFLRDARLIDRKNPIIDLYYANLSGLYLIDSTLGPINLSGAYLDRSTLSGTSLAEADLSNVRLTDADLLGTIDQCIEN